MSTFSSLKEQNEVRLKLKLH